MSIDYRDCKGIAFSYSQLQGLHLPSRPGDWPRIIRVKDGNVCRLMHHLWRYCWFCGCDVGVECHHLFAGRKGRSDELTAIVMACGDAGFGKCHRRIESGKITEGQVLSMKAQMDRIHTDWVRLTQLACRWLKPLEHMEIVCHIPW